jgi:maleate cis-trans isomerase
MPSTAAARLGFVIPAPNRIFEDDLLRLGVREEACVIRMPWPEDTEGGPAIEREFGRAIGELAKAKCAAVCFACSSATMIDAASNARYREMMSSACGCPSVTAGDAVVRALARMNCHTVGILGPYSSAVVEAEAGFLEASGLVVAARDSWGLPDSQIADVSASAIASRWSSSTWRTAVEATVIACATFRGVEAESLMGERGGKVLPVNRACVAEIQHLAAETPSNGTQ